MTILTHNNEFVIIDDIPVRKKDVRIGYVDANRVQFSNIATEDRLMRSELYSAISVDGVFYTKKDDLAVVLANIFTTNGDISFEGIELIKGLKGDKGDIGNTGPQGIQGIPGINGTNGVNGLNGIDGIDGSDGISAYQVALNNGFVGTESAWLLSLKGETGSQGPIGLTGPAGTNGTNGSDGATGPQGIQGLPGTNASISFTEVIANFGLITEAKNNTTLSVSDTNVLSGSKIICHISNNETLDHSIDEIMVLQFSAFASNINAGVGFDIQVFSPHKTYGQIKINYLITN